MYGRSRRITQLIVFAAMFAIPILNLYEIYWITGTFYAINIGGLGIADPVVIFQAIFAAASLTLPLLSAALFPVALALIFGRIWCGWMCPYHLLSDCAVWLGSKLKRSPLQAGSSFTPFRSNVVRFAFLALGAAAAGAVGIPVLNYFSAPGIVSAEAMILIKEQSVSLEFAFIVVILSLELTALPRFWCRLFCPTGSFLSVFRAPFSLRVENAIENSKTACCKENHCSSVCPMGLSPYREGCDLLCTNCGLCVDACPSRRLRFKGFRIT
jgi:ferredoxin-type protein NapH